MKAVVLMNMGGATSKRQLKEFLHNMFNDYRIIGIRNNFLRSLVAFIIVTLRLNKAWKNYEKIDGKSPIYDITASLVKKIQKKHPDIFITFVMRYTQPMAQETIQELETKGIKEVLLLPLYPQFSTTTTQSSLENFILHAKKKLQYKIQKPFYQDNTYNTLLIKIIQKTLNNDNPNDFELIFSAHGLPQKIIDNGDPYQKQLIKQIALLETMLKKKKLFFGSVTLAYQSKIGPMKWLEPSLGGVLATMQGKKVVIVPIAFAIDNSETVFELSKEYHEIAAEIGVCEYRVCPCPNDNVLFVSFLSSIITQKFHCS